MEREILRHATIPNMNNVSNFSLNTQVAYRLLTGLLHTMNIGNCSVT